MRAQSLVADDAFQHILRVLNTNVDGKQKIMFALTAIRGIGRRFSNICCKKAEVDMTKRCATVAAPAPSDSVCASAGGQLGERAAVAAGTDLAVVAANLRAVHCHLLCWRATQLGGPVAAALAE